MTPETPSLAPSDAPTCSDFWGCVAASVDSITKALPELYQSDGYSRIELTKQLDRLVDIMERAAHPMMKIDGQNDKSAGTDASEKTL